jgi:hypothetical protein
MDWQNSLPLTVARPVLISVQMIILFCPFACSLLAGYVAFHKTLAETATAAR